MYDYLIVGCGLFGSVFAEHAIRHGKKVLVIDKREHIAGNCYTKNIENINVHQYGPHIFHTNSGKIWDYINKFTKFNNFVNRPKVNYKDSIYSFPINLFTLYQLWGVQTPKDALLKLKEVCLPIKNPQNMEEWLLANVGEEIYHKFFYGYTVKQWKKSPKELPSSTIKRLPIRMNFNDNYFNDTYQGIPVNGYTEIFEKLLNKAEIKLNTSLEDVKNWKSIAKKLVYSGRPEELLDYKYGELEYLTLKFEFKILDEIDNQGNAIINYTEENVPYTRKVEHKHFEDSKSDKTVVSFEYPVNWTPDATPYYPVNTSKNNELYQRYKKDIVKDNDIILGGRLGRYQYMDMDQVIGNAISEAECIL